MNYKKEIEKKNLMIDDLLVFTENLTAIIEEVVERTVKKEVTPIKELLNQIAQEKEYTIQEVATITGKHHKTIRNWIDLGDLKAYKLGKVWMIKHNELEAFKNSRLEKDPYDKIFKTI